MNAVSLKFKLLLGAGALVTLTAIVMISAMILGMNRNTVALQQTVGNALQEQLLARINADAGTYGEQIARYLDRNYENVLTLVALLQDSISHTERRLTRGQLEAMVFSTVTRATDVSSAYAEFEPNGFDGNDAAFAQGASHSVAGSGAISAYFVRNADGSIAQEQSELGSRYSETKNEYGQREGEWYLCPRDTGKPCTLEPYLYEISPGHSELMTSLTAPVITEGKFRGVVGVDINLPVFQDMMMALSKQLFDGAAQVTLVSDGGLIIGSSHMKNAVSKRLQDSFSAYNREVANLLKSGGTVENADSITVVRTIPIAAAGMHWSLLIEVPKAKALAVLHDMQQQIETQKNDLLLQQALIALVIALFGIGINSLLITSITRPLARLAQRMDGLASNEGDLTASMNIATHAELIAVGDGFNRFLTRLRHLVSNVKRGASQAQTLASKGAALAHETEQQTARQQNEIISVVTAMNEMAVTAGEVARFAADAAGNAREARDFVLHSRTTLATSVEEVRALSHDMLGASEAISKVARRSDEINGIIAVIHSISEQTNLLALNAAIEAARAGEQGRGFAVVADEVRSLASRTGSSTAEIAQLIKALENDVKMSVDVIRAGVGKADTSAKHTGVAFDALVQVAERIDAISDHMTQVATAAEQQSTVSEEINANITIIGDAAQELRGYATQMSSTGGMLNDAMSALYGEVARLKTE